MDLKHLKSVTRVWRQVRLCRFQARRLRKKPSRADRVVFHFQWVFSLASRVGVTNRRWLDFQKCEDELLRNTLLKVVFGSYITFCLTDLQECLSLYCSLEDCFPEGIPCSQIFREASAFLENISLRLVVEINAIITCVDRPSCRSELVLRITQSSQTSISAWSYMRVLDLTLYEQRCVKGIAGTAFLSAFSRMKVLFFWS